MIFIHPSDGERHFSHAHRFATIGAVENDVGHFSAAEGLSRLLTEHPSDGVRNVGFAAPVRTDNGGHPGLEIQ